MDVEEVIIGEYISTRVRVVVCLSHIANHMTCSFQYWHTYQCQHRVVLVSQNIMYTHSGGPLHVLQYCRYVRIHVDAGANLFVQVQCTLWMLAVQMQA